jgi:hypothetical protein
MEKLTTGNLSPAYGRDYKSKAAVLADFYAGKNFVLSMPWESTYCSVLDFADGARVQFRFKQLRNTFVERVRPSTQNVAKL